MLRSMKTPEAALEEILGQIEPLGQVEELPLAFASGRILAEAPVSDVAVPPFRKAMMDGFACRSADLASLPRTAEGVRLALVGESRAGAPFEGLLLPGQAIEIYTGAEVPEELDQVVMVERSLRQGQQVVLGVPARPGEHIQPVADILAAGDRPIPAGQRLGPADLAVLAALGAHPLRVFRAPRVGVLTTGDELVPPWVQPGPGQIREGNTLYLAARLLDLGVELSRVGIVPDDPEILEHEFRTTLEQSDALVTTGGVSMGKYDLVGQTFEKLGVRALLHKVAVKPGKPIWFGMQGRKPILGLPGNPVSALLGLEAFVRPALAKLSGARDFAPHLGRGVWRGPALEPYDRQQNLPCRLLSEPDGRLGLEPIPWKGSSDILSAARAQALAVIDAQAPCTPGQVLRFRPL
jgi:molybdopterin molybdotransferase